MELQSCRTGGVARLSLFFDDWRLAALQIASQRLGGGQFLPSRRFSDQLRGTEAPQRMRRAAACPGAAIAQLGACEWKLSTPAPFLAQQETWLGFGAKALFLLLVPELEVLCWR